MHVPVIIFRIAVIVFVAEGLIMAGLSLIGPLSPVLEAACDALALVVLTTPFIFYFAIKPYVDDRTEKLTRARKEAEIASRLKDDILANMSHELRTPLNAIIGFSSMMSAETFGHLNEKYREYANDISQSGAHLLELINDVLDVSAIGVGKLALHEDAVAIGEVVESAMNMVRARAREGAVHLVGTVDDGLPLLHADRRRVMQILLNLLSNAVKFTPPGGKVALAVSLDAAGGFVVSVTDTGIGMDEAGVVKALSEFGQVDSGLGRKQDGTGLGLPLTRGLVELHGGTLTIASTVDVGTTVTVRFPPERVLASGQA